MSKDKEIDELSGVETTGHEWDGLKELNNPAPRWWLIVFYITIAWSVVYWVLYPSWPTISGNTQGILEKTQYTALADSQKEILKRQKEYLSQFEKASFDEIMDSESLYSFAIAGGRAAFKDNCATCHGTGGQGAKGYPNLNDNDWIWGGGIVDIYQTLLYGIRSGHEDSHFSIMQAYGKDGLLDSKQISDVVDYVLSLPEGGRRGSRGYKIFQENCASCHGRDAAGDKSLGAPNLKDSIWLYGGDRKSVFESVYYGRGGVMPGWADRLDKNTIRQLAVYVHELDASPR
jgi:cytochrome c oxidase cbb3-type subunit 3